MYMDDQSLSPSTVTLGRWLGQIFSGLHNTFALVGVLVLAVTTFWASAPEVRLQGIQQWAFWTQSQKLAVLGVPHALTLHKTFDQEVSTRLQDQEAVTDWLSRKYKVSPKVLAPLVSTSYNHALSLGMDPTLILAVMAVESRFNPFAKNAAGAQGLMQISAENDAQIYDLLGGQAAALDPSTNIRIGSRLLKLHIERAQGSVPEALRSYSSNRQDQLDLYAEKVLMEQSRLQWVAQGKRVPFAYWPQGLTATHGSGLTWNANDQWKKL
jgi:Transglycosylase SLT domain